MKGYKYGPNDDVPDGTVYADIHPDNDVWPTHSSEIEEQFERILEDVPDEYISKHTMLTPAMTYYHASINLPEEHDEVPMGVGMAVEMHGWEVYEFNGRRVRVRDPDQY